MLNVLFTGAQGFIGRNILPLLEGKYNFFTPSRFELDLLDEKSVREYVELHKIDVIVHSANPNPYKEAQFDKNETFLKDSLRMFFSIHSCKDLVKKVIFFGSGAMYDKSRDIVDITESEFGSSIPKEDYGFAKYTMGFFARDNVFNLVLFGCYGPSDDKSKFITHCIRCVLRNEKITIRQNCLFDYLHVYDLAKVLDWVINNDKLIYNTLNVVSGVKISLLDIAVKVKKLMQSNMPIVILQEGMNKEYTASNKRLRSMFNDEFISIDDGIAMQIKWEIQNFMGEE